ncbi:hypothetical protein JCM3770_000858, partial [Rhodotorula araucariae]
MEFPQRKREASHPALDPRPLKASPPLRLPRSEPLRAALFDRHTLAHPLAAPLSLRFDPAFGDSPRYEPLPAAMDAQGQSPPAFHTLQQPGYPLGPFSALDAALSSTLPPGGLPPHAPALAGAVQGAYTDQAYPPPVHHDTAMSPASAAALATPALSSSAMSLSSSHDTLATPSFPPAPHPFATGTAPYGSYGHAPSLAGSDYLGTASPGAPPVGLGFAQADAAHGGYGKEQQGAVFLAEAQSMPLPPSPGLQEKRQTVRPAEVRRRGEDLGLSLGDFDMLETLGTGTFGRVVLARLRTSPTRPSQTQPHYFAMKVLEKNTVVRLRQVEHVNSERSTLAHVQHPFVVNLFCTFQDETNLYLLLEYVQGGELFSHLRRAGRFSADVARFYCACLVLVLEDLHSQDIIYRDLKPENLLIDSTGHIKVTDFGF